MGQYYHTVLERNNKLSVIMPVVNGEWQGLKLTEHSWLENEFMSIIAKKIYKKPTRIIWLGDYAEDEELQSYLPNETVNGLYEKASDKGVTCKNINYTILKDKYLVNHDKKVYIDMNRYILIADEFNSKEDKGWIINPISLLTALGNNRGGGDYYNSDRTTCFDSVGTWTYDLISVEDKAPTDYVEETHIVFTEQVDDTNKNLIDVYGLNTSLVGQCK